MKIDTSLATTQTISLQSGFPPSTANSLNPHEIMLSKDKKNLYVTCQLSNDVRIYNIPTGSITVIPVGGTPLEMALSETKNKLYVTCTDDITSFPGFHGTVSEILLGGTYPEQRIPVGFMPHGIAVDEANNLIYVASRNLLTAGPTPHHSSVCAGRNGFVNFIDLNTFTLKTRRTEISVDPYSAAIRK